MYRLAYLLIFIGVVGCVDLNIGSKDFSRKIFDEDLCATPGFRRRTTTITVTADVGEVISAISVTDNRPKKDGVVKIVEGGERQKTVVLKLESPAALRGYDFHVEIYSQPEFQARDVPVASVEATRRPGDEPTTTNPET